MKSDKTRKTIQACFLILSFYYITLSFTPLANIYFSDYGETSLDVLTLGYNNPNETAMYLFACFLVLVTMFFETRLTGIRLLLFLDIVFLIGLILATEARTAILVVGMFLLVLFLCRNKKIPNSIFIISFLIPIVFLILILGENQEFLGLEFLGDAIDTGRIDIYERVLNKLNITTLFVGSYDFKFENLHNAFWSIFATVGLFGVVAYFGLVISKVKKIHQKTTSNGKGKIALLGLLCIFAYTATEAAFLTSGGSFAAMVSSVYLLSACYDD